MVLTIAGSDPSGGAGVQADVKTCTVLGVYCGAAITCITVQNTKGVRFFSPLAPELVEEQITAVLCDMPVTHIKIGMVGSAAVAAAISSALSGFSGEIICDPVLAASSGTRLIAESELEVVLKNLYRRATVLTPNLPELEKLSGKRCPGENSLKEAAEILFRSLPSLRALVVKGGHLDSPGQTVIDYLFLAPGRQTEIPHFSKRQHPRVISSNTHGTGCTFASAYAAFHLRHGSDLLAFAKASDFVGELVRLSSTARLGDGRGPLLHYLLKGNEIGDS